MGKVKPRNKLRFALVGRRGRGLVGSTALRQQPAAGRAAKKIALYLNFDMIGSPNYVFFIYDGDDSDVVGAGPGPGARRDREGLRTYYRSSGRPFKGTDFTGAGTTARSSRWASLRRPVHRDRGHQERRRRRDSGVARRARIRPVLPPGLRHVRQHQPVALDVNATRWPMRPAGRDEHGGGERPARQGQLQGGPSPDMKGHKKPAAKE